MEIYDVVTKLIGPVKPVGETNADNERFENLSNMCDLVDKLLTDIDDVGMQQDRHEFSRKRAGEYASKFLTRIGIVE